MRADRLLSILLLLQTHRRLTARALAERLEVSERTVHRDMEALSASGVPVRAERGANGGWVLDAPYRTDLTGLSAAELQALFLTPPVQVAGALGLQGAREAALIKLVAALPTSARHGVQNAPQRLHIDGASWRQGAEPLPCLPAVQQAVWGERRLRLAYQRDDGVVERTVDPLGLVVKGSTWYLVAAVEGSPRTYRLSRVQAAEVLDAAAERPAGFDLAAFWDASARQFIARLPQYPVTVRLAPDAYARLGRPGMWGEVVEAGEPDAAGWRTVRLLLETHDDAAAYLLGFGPRCEVVAPVELRATVAAAAAATAAVYRTD